MPFNKAIVDLVTSEIQIINQLFADHKVQAGVIPSDTFIYPTYITYHLTQGKGVAISKIKRLEKDIANAITRHRRLPLIKVRFKMVPLSLEIPRPDPQPIHLTELTISIPSHTLLFGQSYSHGQEKLEARHFDRVKHLLVAGETGSGKSVLLTGLLLKLCENSSPDELRLHLIDLKKADFLPLKRLPHVETFAGDIDTAATVIDQVYDTLQQRIRSESHKQFSPRHVVVIDEAQLLLKDKAYKSTHHKFENLTATGRSMGVHMVVATQYPKAEAVKSMIKVNIPTRVVGTLDSAKSSEVATGSTDAGAHNLPRNQGAFLLVDGGDLTRIQSFLIEDDQVSAYVDRIIHLYPDHISHHADTNSPLNTSSSVSAIPARIQQLADQKQVKATFAEYFDPATGELRYKGKSALVKAMFGEYADPGGHQWRLAMQVFHYLKQQQAEVHH